MQAIKNWEFIKESEKYKFFTIKDIQNFMAEHIRIPYTWDGAENYKSDYVSIKNSTTPITSFYNGDKEELRKVPVNLKAKLGSQLVPSALIVNDFTFKILLYRHIGGKYGCDRVMDFSDEWCIDRLAAKGEDYRKALLHEVKERQIAHIQNGDREIEILQEEIKRIKSNIEINLDDEETRLGKILDGAVRKTYAPGSAAMQVVNKNKTNGDTKSLEESNKELIDTVYGAGYYDYVIENKGNNQSKSVVKETPKSEKITDIVFGYDHDEVVGRGR